MESYNPRNKHILCTADQMNAALIACLKCLKPGRSDEHYQAFCKAIRNLLLSDGYDVDKKELTEEFALVDSSYYLFTIVREGVTRFRSTKNMKDPVLFAAFKILTCLLSQEFQRRLDSVLEDVFSMKLWKIYKDDIPTIFEGATQVFKLKKETGKRNKRAVKKAISAQEVNVALSVFHVYIALGTQGGNQLDGSNLSLISVSLDYLYDLDRELMTDENFKLLCSSFHNLLAQAVYNELKSSISQILNSLEVFQGNDALRQALITHIRKEFSAAGGVNPEEEESPQGNIIEFPYS